VAIIGGAVYLEKDKLGLSSSGIRSVDLRNSPVEVVGTACADPQLTTAGITKLPLHEGAYQLGQYQFELVGDVRYGDVSGHTSDGNSEKAVFVGSCSAAGKTSQVLFVYGMMDGNPERLASNDLSAVGNTLVQSYSVGDGAIQVKANQGDPPTLVTMSFALLNGNLVNLNPAPAQPTPPPVAQTTAQTAAAGTSDTIVNPQEQNTPSIQEDQVGFQAFHDTLAPYGNWTHDPRWGTVWHPTQVSADFRPYRDGHWEDTDEYGTVWVSDYSWGDIPFHYGRWGYDPSQGWLWQPGYTWSPAWVVWREGGGNIGWFPTPPGYYDASAAFADDWDGWYGYRDLYGAALDAAAFYALWSFVPADDIYAPAIGVDVIAPGTNVGFIGRTRDWTRFGVARGHLVNRAIDRGRFRSAFGHPLPTSARHDFASHHGPIVGVAKGRSIAAREHAPVGASFRTTAFGASRSHHISSFGHPVDRGSFRHASGGGHSDFAGGTSQRGFAGDGRQRGFGGDARQGGFGGSERQQNGGRERPSFGGGERPTAGRGMPEQRPGFDNGMAHAPQQRMQMQRPSPTGSTQRHH
jgi:hypothetical protein